MRSVNSQHTIQWQFNLAGGAQAGAVTRDIRGSVFCGQLVVTGDAGATVAASGTLYVSNLPDDPNSWIPLRTYSATGTTTGHDEGVDQCAWRAVRFDLSSISGAGALATFALSTGG